MLYTAKGIDDGQSKIYRDFDRSGRDQNSMNHKAGQAGVQNLKTNSYKMAQPYQLR